MSEAREAKMTRSTSYGTHAAPTLPAEIWDIIFTFALKGDAWLDMIRIIVGIHRSAQRMLIQLAISMIDEEWRVLFDTECAALARNASHDALRRALDFCRIRSCSTCAIIYCVNFTTVVKEDSVTLSVYSVKSNAFEASKEELAEGDTREHFAFNAIESVRERVLVFFTPGLTACIKEANERAIERMARGASVEAIGGDRE